MKTYNGSCHCGAIKFTFRSKPITKGLHCNCSICKRKGAMMLADPVDEADITIEANPENVGRYQFDSGVAKHYFCKNCGIYTHHETSRYPGKYRVNLGCIDDVDQFALDYDVFNGKDWYPD